MKHRGSFGKYFIPWRTGSGTLLRVVRLLRSPRELSQVETLLEMRRDVVASFKQFAKTRLMHAYERVRDAREVLEGFTWA